ncbi:Pc06g00120 [Penicillium rubens Wisconsin 54-1255]|uniref:Pc06g00120 protein n=2 Tax=Penicillium chrysogenum species complex TaxID=254878 RepID=B6GVV8_PENRW|nr:uncharacterized protein N7525_010127 [Penicillium rubens]KAJ5274322.1 hypothetical protein N7505_002867 [Penicillium chrysogenum]CAP79005.1 Pc06g00120 [Penicillium rubens Wisconsin 54-1255]KAJ5820843.1 hypothetical protein N7525_010127 [Penicillium rubens]KAJ5858491.1 hypothetical protein N7534_003768 [Penicillium rubens]KAJ6156037.1 hypothetical protein N7497_004922 [Penicillium chrysogenum]
MRLNVLPTRITLASQAMAALSQSELQTRYPTESFSILAYGVAPEGANVFYSDGFAYVGNSSQWVAGSVTTDVAFVFKNSGIIATATDKDYTFDPDTSLYIRPTPNKVLPVGFTGNNVDTPEDATVNRFLFYGRYLMWQNENGLLCDSFRLKGTHVDGIYQLYWDTSNLFPPGFLIPTVKSSV